MKQFLLWFLAVIITIIAVLYQRATGPTYPFKGVLSTNNLDYKYKLIRTHETTDEATITLPDTKAEYFSAFLHYKRYQTKDSLIVIPLTAITLEPEEGFLFNIFPSLKRKNDKAFGANLPLQPAAGKMEYYITGKIDGTTFRIPEIGQDNILLRYKDPVPNNVLVPHIFLMFFAILFGMRAAISAFFDPKTMRKWVLVSFIGMSIGGMVLGPMVQKYAFGEYWTGFPYGGDFTDNKMLIMWLAWAIALAVIGLKPKKKENVSRIIVLVAAVVMTVVYLIPHSMGGSTLDYEQIDQGIDPSEAIKTGAE
jgi:hypothetical protein